MQFAFLLLSFILGIVVVVLKFTFIFGSGLHVEIKAQCRGESFQAHTERKRAQPSNLLCPLLLLPFIFWGRKQDSWGNRHFYGQKVPGDKCPYHSASLI